MNFVSSIFKTFAPRVIGAAVTGLAGWLYAKSKGTVMVDPQMATEMIVGALVTYSATHRGVSSIVNPGDAAKGRIADAEKAAAEIGSTVYVRKAE